MYVASVRGRFQPSAFRASIATAISILFVAVATPSIVLAQPWEQSKTAPTRVSEPSSKQAKVQNNGLYAFEISCTPLADLEDPSGTFVSRNRGLFVLITAGTPIAGASSDKLPAEALAAMQIYSIGTDKNTKQPIVVDFRSTCNSNFLVRGSDKLKIVTTENYLDDFDNTVFGDVLSGVLGLVSPLFSLFTGGPLPAAITGNLTDATSVRGNVTKILSALNRGVNKTTSAGISKALREGTYVFKTKYVRFSILVRPISSIVLDQNADYRDDLVKKVFGTSLKLDSSKLAENCSGAKFDIKRLGFFAPIDVAFGITNLAAHAGFSKANLISCLTQDYAPAAASGGSKFWVTELADMRFTANDIAAAYPDESKRQPKWASVRSFMNDLAISLGQYLRNDPPPEEAESDLRSSLSSVMTLSDRSTSLAIGSERTSIDRFALLGKLKQKGYIRVGCAAPTTNADPDVDGATAMFLLVKASNDAASAPLSAALLVRPFFKDNKVESGIERFVISDNQAWMTAALTSQRDFECNGFRIEKPPGYTAKPVTAALQ